MSVYEMATRYAVSGLPPDDPESATWGLAVEYRATPGKRSWAVCFGGHQCLSRKGEWEYEPSPSNRTPRWLGQHRFTFDEAMEWARRLAPKITVNGLTAADVLARRAQRAIAPATASEQQAEG